MDDHERNGENIPITLAAVDRASVRERSPRDILVAIPAYNEERFIGSVVLQVGCKGFPVVVIDDGSTDGTAAVAAAAGATVERHERNLGKAEAVNTAFRCARAAGVAALVIMDGDSQHDASEIDGLLAPILADQADIVIGSRFLASSGGRIPGLRSLGQRGMTIATNLASGTPVTDSQSGFRAFSRHAIDALLFSARGFSVEGEMQFQARDHNLRLIEMPITARYSDPPKRNILQHGIHVLDGVLRLAIRHRPLLFFAIPGALLILAGSVVGAMVIDIYQSTRLLAIGYGLLTVLLTMVGLLGLFTGVMLHALRGTYLDVDKRLIALNAARESRPVQLRVPAVVSEPRIALTNGAAIVNGDAK